MEAKYEPSDTKAHEPLMMLAAMWSSLLRRVKSFRGCCCCMGSDFMYAMIVFGGSWNCSDCCSGRVPVYSTILALQ